MTVELEPDHVERADRFGRSVTLSSSLEYLVAVVPGLGLGEAFARRVVARSVTLDGRPQLLIVDLTGLLETEQDSALVFARGLNARRDVLSATNVGGLLLCVPDWLERPFAAAAPDLWSVVTSTALRRGDESFPARLVDEWWDECDEAFADRRAELDEDIYRAGTYTYAYAFEPGALELSNHELLDRMRRLPQYTGWSTWLVPDGSDELYPADAAIECWLAQAGRSDPAHADFWRARGTGYFYLRRGYAEDAEHEPGRVLSASLPIWRLGEALLHARDLARSLGLRAHVRLRVRGRWDGLQGRTLSRWPEAALVHVRPASSRTPSVRSDRLLEVGDLDDLPSLVGQLTAGLFECFEFYRPSEALLADHLRRLETRS